MGAFVDLEQVVLEADPVTGAPRRITNARDLEAAERMPPAKVWRPDPPGFAHMAPTVYDTPAVGMPAPAVLGVDEHGEARITNSRDLRRSEDDEQS